MKFELLSFLLLMFYLNVVRNLRKMTLNYLYESILHRILNYADIMKTNAFSLKILYLYIPYFTWIFNFTLPNDP